MNRTAARTLTFLVIGLIAALSAGLGGCQQKLRMGRYDLGVTPDSTLREGGRMPLVEVDLVGVAESDVGQWQAYDVSRYFSGEDQLRRSAASYTHTLRFSNDDAGTKVIPASDPMWKVWQDRGVTTLFVMANSRTMQFAPGADFRKKMIPLTTDKWDSSTRRLEIVVTSGKVDCTTPMKVVK
ncbi:MAG: hypothetical protein SFY69_08615 [Planctomycetota bacterium]|nr:hypothetical protein [Planctomycetota bacterium]